MLFVDWQSFGLTINGAGGGKNEAHDVGLAHCFEEVSGAFDIIFHIKLRLLHRFIDEAQSGKVEHGANVMLFENCVDGRGVKQIDFFNRKITELAKDLKRLVVAAKEIVEDNDRKTFFKEKFDGVRADVAGAAGDEDWFHSVVSVPYGIKKIHFYYKDQGVGPGPETSRGRDLLFTCGFDRSD